MQVKKAMKKQSQLEKTFDEIQTYAEVNSDRDKYISKRELAKETKTDYRTSDYYSRYGLIKKPIKIGKEACWEQDYIVDELRAIRVLNADFEFSLTEIKELVGATNYELARITDWILTIISTYLNQTSKLYKNFPGYRHMRREDRYDATKAIWNAFFKHVKEGRLDSDKQLIKFQELIDKVYYPKMKKALISWKEFGRWMDNMLDLTFEAEDDLENFKG